MCWVVPGAINSASSKGANRLLVPGRGSPWSTTKSFSDVLFSRVRLLEGCSEAKCSWTIAGRGAGPDRGEFKALPAALQVGAFGQRRS